MSTLLIEKSISERRTVEIQAPFSLSCRAANPNHSQLSSYIALCLIVTPTHEEMNQIYKAYWTHQPN